MFYSPFLSHGVEMDLGIFTGMKSDEFDILAGNKMDTRQAGGMFPCLSLSGSKFCAGVHVFCIDGCMLHFPHDPSTFPFPFMTIESLLK